MNYASTDLSDTYWKEIIQDDTELERLSQDLFRPPALMSQRPPCRLVTIYRSNNDNNNEDDNDPDNNHIPPITNNEEGSTTSPRTEAGDLQPV